MRLVLKIIGVAFALWSLSLSSNLLAQDTIELETTRIKGNTELPKYMYVVPWQDKERINKDEQKLVLHNLYSDLFDPVMPDYIAPLPPPPVIDDFPMPDR